MPHVNEAVRSILGQTLGDFEFVIYDDASTDGSRDRLREWATRDDRIRLIEGDRNLGPVGSSAFVVEHSRAPLVARMDADDVCSADRLERQLEVLRNETRAGLVGTLFEIIDDRGRLIRGPDYWRLARASGHVPFAAHGSIMFRRSVFDKVGGYRRECEYWEDQDLVVRIAGVAEVWVIPCPLYKVRQWTRNTSATSQPERVENAVDLAYRSIALLEKNQSYDHLLHNPPTPSRVDPGVFVSTGSRILWAGERPHLFSRLLRRGKLRADARTIAAMTWTAWAAASPYSLRQFLNVLIWIRNWRAGKLPTGEAPIRWQPPVQESSAERHEGADGLSQRSTLPQARG
jgi:GT2 family glycosyltransferase